MFRLSYKTYFVWEGGQHPGADAFLGGPLHEDVWEPLT